MRASTLLTTVAALVATTAAADPPAAATPTPPKLVYLASANLTIPPPLDLGVGPQGSRAMLTISGGTVWGPRLSGTFQTLCLPHVGAVI